MGEKREVGRPKVIENGRTVRVLLDEKSIEKAKSIGAGSISAGIRISLNKQKV